MVLDIIRQMCTVQDLRFFSKGSSEIELRGFVWTPRNETVSNLVCVLVHPWGVLGGSSANTEPFAEILASTHGVQCITFDLRGVGKSGGKKSYKCVDEIKDVEGACEYVSVNLKKDVRGYHTIFYICSS